MFVTHIWWEFAFRWLHIMSGVMWIGLLWYFNFVQTPSMPKIPDEQKPAISKVIAPAALFWFRWGAMSTIVTGLILAAMSGYLLSAIKLGIGDHAGKNTAIGLGMWLGTIMWFNVWFIIWPNQKKAVGAMNLMIAGFWSSGIFGIDGVWTKLKYQSRPIHITPERMCSQRMKNAQ